MRYVGIVLDVFSGYAIAVVQYVEIQKCRIAAPLST